MRYYFAIYFYFLSSLSPGFSSFSPPHPLLFHGCSFKARTGALEPSELETFKKQAECLKFLPEYHFGGKGQPSLQLTVLPMELDFLHYASHAIFFTNHVLVFQICVQMTGKLLQRIQRMIKLLISLLSRAEHRGVKAL